MPNYFRPKLRNRPELLTSKDHFLAIDIELCKMLEVKPDDIQWVNQWVDTIGFNFAMGDSTDKIKARYETDDWKDQTVYAAQCIKIVDWLVEHCDIDCYYAPKC